MKKGAAPKTAFAEFDPDKLFNYRRMMANWSQLAGEARAAGVDWQELVASHRRNLEAVTKANQLSIEGAQAVLRRQGEIMRQAMSEAVSMSRELVQAGGPEEKLARQAELAKEAFEMALANMREVAEMVSRSNHEALDLVNRRVSEGLDEIKTALRKRAGRK